MALSVGDRERLPAAVVGDELVEEIESEGPRFYRPESEPRIPLEFADAAFRYGHSQIRDDFVLNDRSGPLRLFPDLLGFRPVSADHAIDWWRLFDVPGKPPAQRAKRLDGRLSQSLIELPRAITGGSSSKRTIRLPVVIFSAVGRTRCPRARASPRRWERFR